MRSFFCVSRCGLPRHGVAAWPAAPWQNRTKMLGRIRLQLGSPYQVSEFQHVPTVSNIWKGHVGSRFGTSTPPHGVFV